MVAERRQRVGGDRAAGGDGGQPNAGEGAVAGGEQARDRCRRAFVFCFVLRCVCVCVCV